MVKDVFDSTGPMVALAATKRCEERPFVLIQRPEGRGSASNGGLQF